MPVALSMCTCWALAHPIQNMHVRSLDGRVYVPPCGRASNDARRLRCETSAATRHEPTGNVRATGHSRTRPHETTRLPVVLKCRDAARAQQTAPRRRTMLAQCGAGQSPRHRLHWWRTSAAIRPPETSRVARWQLWVATSRCPRPMRGTPTETNVGCPPRCP